MGITPQEIKLLNLMQLVIDGGWIIDQYSLKEIFNLSGITEVQEKVRKRNATANLRDLLAMKNDVEWKKSLAVVQSAKDLSKMLGIESFASQHTSTSNSSHVASTPMKLIKLS